MNTLLLKSSAVVKPFAKSRSPEFRYSSSDTEDEEVKVLDNSEDPDYKKVDFPEEYDSDSVSQTLMSSEDYGLESKKIRRKKIVVYDPQCDHSQFEFWSWDEIYW